MTTRRRSERSAHFSRHQKVHRVQRTLMCLVHHNTGYLSNHHFSDSRRSTRLSYLMSVFSLMQSSKRIAYLHSSEFNIHLLTHTFRYTHCSDTTGAYNRLYLSSDPASARYCVICVVFPEPVSPTITTI